MAPVQKQKRNKTKKNREKIHKDGVYNVFDLSGTMTFPTISLKMLETGVYNVYNNITELETGVYNVYLTISLEMLETGVYNVFNNIAGNVGNRCL